MRSRVQVCARIRLVLQSLSAETPLLGSPGYFDEGAIYSFFWLPTVQAVSARLKELDGKPGFDDYVKERKRIKQAATVDGAAIGRWWATWQASKNMDAWDAKFSRQEKYDDCSFRPRLRAAHIDA